MGQEAQSFGELIMGWIIEQACKVGLEEIFDTDTSSQNSILLIRNASSCLPRYLQLSICIFKEPFDLFVITA